MNSLERTQSFIKNQPVDRPPFHPIIMRFAAKYAGANYRDFCLDYKTKCAAMIRCARDFSLDWVTVMSDPYAEAEALGLTIEYPQNNLPIAKKPLNLDKLEKIRPVKVKDYQRLSNRIRAIEEYQHLVGTEYFIVGWVEGPMAEYAYLRGLSDACTDLITHPERVDSLSDIIVENATRFITAQIAAGAHCIGIGDSACSLIGPNLYRQFFFDRHRILVEHIHSLGALAKLHICGDTTGLLPYLIETGADIVDVDHLVASMEDHIPLLHRSQVLCGNSDPVSIIQNGNRETIAASVRECFKQARGRGIVSAGCEITPETTIDNFSYYRDSVLAFAIKNR